MERPEAIIQCCSWPASSHAAQGTPGKAVLEDGNAAVCTHVRAYVPTPMSPAAGGLAAAEGGNVKEKSLK